MTLAESVGGAGVREFHGGRGIQFMRARPFSRPQHAAISLTSQICIRYTAIERGSISVRFSGLFFDRLDTTRCRAYLDPAGEKRWTSSKT
jgi:hypothetical protein